VTKPGIRPGYGRGPSQIPLTAEERGYWAIQRVLDAARLLAKDPDDRAYVLAVGSRVREYDEISTAEERRAWLAVIERANQWRRKAAQDPNRVRRGRPPKPLIVDELVEEAV
jgi:hypothetical protein